MTYAQAVALYGCPRALAIAVGVDYSAVAKWKHRGKIPREHALELLLIHAPGAYETERAALLHVTLHRHTRAVRYLRERRPELLPLVKLDQLAPTEDA